jgi:predicted CXXCH cytochrome family protein
MVEHTGLKRLRGQKCAFMIFLTITLLLVFVTGCDKYSKYKVMTFFFTGVPPLEKNDLQASLGSTVQVEVEKVEARRKQPSVHGPYASGQCFQCHKIKGEKKALKKGAVPNLQSLPKELLLPKNEICIECHTTKSTASAFTKNLWIHGPVSAGMCTGCHHHHHSPFPYLILKETSRELCSQCHIDGSITEIEEHLQGKECSFCHNPHLGKNRFLLKEDFFETY